MKGQGALIKKEGSSINKGYNVEQERRLQRQSQQAVCT
jgi:hypothetical protein